jgi:hypothetical protein
VTYWIIEHPTRGLIKEVEWDDDGYVPRFTRADMRSDERVKRYYHPREARRDVERLADHKIGPALEIRRSTDWAVVWPRESGNVG